MMGRAGTWARWARRGLVMGLVVLVAGSTASADHDVTFNQANANAGGIAIRGEATGGLSTHAPAGVKGVASAGSGVTYGVWALAASTSGRGVFGHATASSGFTVGVVGRADSTSGQGVFGSAPAGSGTTYGVWGEAYSPNGRGVYGVNNATSGTATAAGVFGISMATSGVATGVYGEANSSIGRGVVGRARATSGATRGVVGRVDSASGVGVLGDATHASGGVGVQGQAASAAGYGVVSLGNARVDGNLHVNGNITKTGAGELVLIDDPQRQRRVVYASLIGPELGTYVRGTAKLVKGVAVITLPDHFAVATAREELTVVLTPVGEWLQLYVAQKGVRRLVVREARGKSGTFDYRVEGVRRGYERHQVVVSR